MRSVIALISGIMFGAGLAVSGMMDPARVRGFLDIFGTWDPTLAFVMGGAVIVMAFAWIIQRRQTQTLTGEAFELPATSRIDGRLIGGAALFGIGWGLAGLCPGPGIALLAVRFEAALVFIVSLAAGMALYALIDKAMHRKS